MSVSMHSLPRTPIALSNAGLGQKAYEKLRSAHQNGVLLGARNMHAALTLYGLEGVMRRLGKAGMLGEVVLKGARLWSVWGGDSLRATQDLDYTAQQPGLRGASSESVMSYARRVIQALGSEVGDGLSVNLEGFRVSRLENMLGGCAIEGEAQLYTARIPIIMEIGFGHTLPEGATQQTRWFPLLKGLGEPLDIQSYTPEMWLAEKLRIAFEYGESNTRLKDFFDMRVLFSMNLDRRLLADCLWATCSDFGVPLPSTVAAVPCFTQEFAQKYENIWERRRWPEWTERPFVRGKDPTLGQVIGEIGVALERSKVLAMPRNMPSDELPPS